MSKSIVTLQLGNYSNFIGTHYWNLHEFAFENSKSNPINNDINYYEGLTVDNDITYTPKVISWDWKENLGPRIIDDIYEELENERRDEIQSRREINSLKVKSFKGKVVVNTGFTEEELNVNKTTVILDKRYEEWNEFLYSRFHPNSLTKLPKLFRNLNVGNFNCFSQGMDLTENLEYRNRMEDQTRYFVEKCDSLQGFQVICDVEDGFSGVGMNFLNHLSDEYSKDIISFPAINYLQNENINHEIESVFNKIFLYNEMNNKSVLWAPISVFNYNKQSVKFPNVDFNYESKYESSAILALALKSSLMPCFSNNDSYLLSDYSSIVQRNCNRMASIALSLPFPLNEKETLESSLLDLSPRKCYQILNPYCEGIDQLNSVIGNICGIGKGRVKNDIRKSKSIFDHCSNANEVMELFFKSCCQSQQLCQFVNSENSILLRKPFPKIFSSKIHSYSGEIKMNSNQEDYLHCPNSIPMSTACLSNDSTSYLRQIFNSADNAFKWKHMSSLLLGMESDYLSEAIENFRNMF